MFTRWNVPENSTETLHVLSAKGMRTKSKAKESTQILELHWTDGVVGTGSFTSAGESNFNSGGSSVNTEANATAQPKITMRLKLGEVALRTQ